MKWIAGYEGRYKISSNGEVYSYVTNKHRGKAVKRKKQVNRYGYQYLDLCKNNKHIKNSIHRLLAIAYIPNPNDKPDVNHINGIKADNRLSNLEWATKSENTQHAHATGLCGGTEGIASKVHTHQKLTAKDVLHIRHVLKNKRRGDVSMLARKYSIHRATIHRINTGKSYKDVA